MLNNSPVLQKIYEIAERFTKKYAGSIMSQAHILLATIVFRDANELDLSMTEEYNKALNNFMAEDAVFNRTVTHAFDFLRLNESPDEDAVALRKCFESASEKAEIYGMENLPVSLLVSEIISYPTAQTKYIFKDIIPCFQDEPSARKNYLLEYQDEVIEVVAPLKELQAKLRSKIYGQDEAINALVSGCFNLVVSSQQDSKNLKPRSVFVFAGAPGVGKTYLAQTFAKAIHLPFRRFDMSSFSDKEAALEFAGTDKVYKASHEGLVTGFVDRHPHCVLLFDEIEKAHPNIIHLFLQILDAGKLKDSHTGKNVLFNNAIIIMTTNAGRSLYDNLVPGEAKPHRKAIINALSTEINPLTGDKFFPAAICSRFAAGNIVLFNPLGIKELLKIGNFAIRESIVQFGRKFDFEIECDENLCAALLFSEGDKADARSFSGRVTNFFNQEIYNWLKFAYEKVEHDLNTLQKLKIRIPLSEQERKLFYPQEKQNILVYSEFTTAFKNFCSTNDYNILNAATPEQAVEMLNENDIAFAICDIFGDERPTLNIEDTSSEGRKLMDTLIKEQVPTFVYHSDRRLINEEEQQALLESGARGFVCSGPKAMVIKTLTSLCKRMYSTKTLRELGRSKKVLSFDCVYNWYKSRKTGIIDLTNLRVIPAVDAQDKDDIAVSMTDVKFDDVIGAEDAKAELKGFISYLKNPKLYSKNKIAAPKGIMLYGPPGTGKTMLAKAFAHESGAAFIATNGNSFLTSKRGGGAAEVRRLFALARKYAPSVIFIDEIDIVAKDRFASSLADDVVNALLNEMDGFNSNALCPVFVLAATNFDVTFGKNSALDKALLRRFDRRIFVDLPNTSERKRFIEKRLKESKQSISQDVINNIVSRSVGMSLAELESVINFALRTMVQSSNSKLSEDMFNESFETFCFGEANSLNGPLLERIAIHEAGHAVLSHNVGIKPSYITITSRGNYGGYTTSDVSNDALITKNDLLNQIKICLAGRAAEIAIYGDLDGISTGAASDFKAATQTVLQMVALYGMSEEHGLLWEENGLQNKDTADLCNKILSEEMQKTIAILCEQKEKINILAKALLEKNHLMFDEIENIMNGLEG